MSDRSYINEADSAIIAEHSDSVAEMFKQDIATLEQIDQYLAAKNRLERLIIGLRDHIKELEDFAKEVRSIGRQEEAEEAHVYIEGLADKAESILDLGVQK